MHAHIEDESKYNFLTGMFVEGEIIVKEFASKAILSEAIVTVDNVSTVLVLETLNGEGYFFKKKQVTIKDSYKGYSILNSSEEFKTDAQFLTKGSFSLLGE